MSTVVEAVLGSFALILLLAALILFGGEPDLADSLMKYFDKQAELLSCPHVQLNLD